jgi:hypothetical protein
VEVVLELIVDYSSSLMLDISIPNDPAFEIMLAALSTRML